MLTPPFDKLRVTSAMPTQGCGLGVYPEFISGLPSLTRAGLSCNLRIAIYFFGRLREARGAVLMDR